MSLLSSIKIWFVQKPPDQYKKDVPMLRRLASTKEQLHLRRKGLANSRRPGGGNGRRRKKAAPVVVAVPTRIEEAPLRRQDRRTLNALNQRKADRQECALSFNYVMLNQSPLFIAFLIKFTFLLSHDYLLFIHMIVCICCTVYNVHPPFHHHHVYLLFMPGLGTAFFSVLNASFFCVLIKNATFF